MKFYGSFLIRCWVHPGDEGQRQIVFDVEHIQKGERLRFGNPNEAWQWMVIALESNRSDSQESVNRAEGENQ